MTFVLIYLDNYSIIIPKTILIMIMTNVIIIIAIILLSFVYIITSLKNVAARVFQISIINSLQTEVWWRGKLSFLECHAILHYIRCWSPNVTRSVVMVSWFTRNYCACAPMLYISELCEDCAVANEIDYEIDYAWASIHDNGHVITACDVWLQQRIVFLCRHVVYIEICVSGYGYSFRRFPGDVPYDITTILQTFSVWSPYIKRNEVISCCIAKYYGKVT